MDKLDTFLGCKIKQPLVLGDVGAERGGCDAEDCFETEAAQE